MRCLPALAGLVLSLAACAPLARAQHVPDHGTDMGSMPGMDHHVPPARAHATHGAAAPEDHVRAMGHPAMHVPASMAQRHQPAMHPPASSSPGHAMGPMQGGAPPPGARDPDYSDGIRTRPIHGEGMAMGDDPTFVSLHVDRLEAFHAGHDNGQQWEIGGGWGDSRDKLWLRTEGERSHGHLASADVEVLWQHAVAAFWDTQLGVRTDVGDGPDRRWAAFGIQGLAPYWFELEATGYLGPGGRTAARLRAEYELLFTQRLVLQPELELNAYGKADPARGLGSGLSDASLGLRLRYEIRREVAPYVGWVWTRRFGGAAGHGPDASERQWVAGVRIRL